MESNYDFVDVKDLIKYLLANPEKEVGFTLDTREDLEEQGEPMGWYGVMYCTAFDGDALLIGWYGGGVEFIATETYNEQEMELGLEAFFKEKEFEELPNEILVDMGDMK